MNAAKSGYLSVTVATNLAQGKTTVASSYSVSKTPGLAVDNNPNSDSSCFGSEYGYNPWWTVDLAARIFVQGVMFVNRLYGGYGKRSLYVAL